MIYIFVAETCSLGVKQSITHSFKLNFKVFQLWLIILSDNDNQFKEFRGINNRFDPFSTFVYRKYNR